MSKYTTEVRYICETANGRTSSTGGNSVDDIITGALSKVFDFSFPIFDESYRAVLERKILKHYYTREIGEETVGLWKLRLNTKLNEIMPYYNKLYESELLEFNPLYTTNLKREGNKEGNSRTNNEKNIDNTIKVTSGETSENISNETNSSDRKTDNTTTNTYTFSETSTEDRRGNDSKWDLYSETPQGSLQNVENETYLTNARKDTTDYNSGTDGSNNGGGNSTNYLDGTDKINGQVNLSANGKVDKTSEHDIALKDVTNGTGNTTEDYLENIVGYEGISPSKLLADYRNTFLNIDMQVINELEVLFINLW